MRDNDSQRFDWFYCVIPLPSRDFRVIRTDLIGHGASSDNNGAYAPEQQARVLSSLLDECGVQDATLVGHSMGGVTSGRGTMWSAVSESHPPCGPTHCCDARCRLRAEVVTVPQKYCPLAGSPSSGWHQTFSQS